MLLSNLNLLATAPDGVASLRELILTLAVQGKLLPQDTSDEPASVLLKKIRAEKDRLIAEGKIKRDKPLTGIVEEEKPFEVPTSWSWSKLGALASKLTDGSHNPPRDSGAGHPMLSSQNVWEGGIIDFTAPSRYVGESDFEIENRRTNATAGDVLLTIVASLGRSAVVPIDAPVFVLQRSVAVIRTGLEPAFLSLFLRSPIARAFYDLHGKGTAQKGIYLGKLGTMPIPVPPLAEQSRIVTRVEELMRLCDALQNKARLEATQHEQLLRTLLGTPTASTTADELAENWQRVATHFDLLLDRPEAVDALEQTILQLAVRGLLVPQDPQDEPAAELLKKIRAEKDRLILDGKIKRDKPLPPIAEGEQPFELPRGWTWARFPELGEFGRGKSKHRPRNDPSLFNPPKYPLIQTGEVSRAKGVVQEVHSYYSDIGLAQSRMWPKGTLCITIAANIAESAVLGFDSCFPDSVVGFVPADAMGNVEYFLLFVETAKADLLAFAPATAQKNINLEILSSLLIPVPPLNELTRIVARVASLRALCADLRQRLTTARTHQALIAQALVQEVA